MWREEGPLWTEKSKCKAWTGRAPDRQGHTLNLGTTTAFVGSYTNCPKLATSMHISSSQEPLMPWPVTTPEGQHCPDQRRPAPLGLLTP